MGLLDNFRNAIVNWLMPDEYFDLARRSQLDKYAELRAYVAGNHRRQLRVKPMQADDNIALNFIGLVVERSISMLFGNGIKFDLPGDDDTPHAVALGEVWRANKQGIFLHNVAQLGATYGTCFVKLIPEGVESRERENAYLPRLVALHPVWMSIETAPEDRELVTSYTMRFNTRDARGREVGRKEVTARVFATTLDADGNIVQTGDTAGWTITNYISSQETGGRWVETSVVDWDYEFAPVLHWQNLPNAESVYGKSDVEDIIPVQDRYNFVQSNNSKIVRYHAHPKTWARGINNTANASWGADEMIVTNSDNALIQNLEMQTDLASSRALAADMRQALFDISRTVDMSSMADKVGSLTNFGLRVLFLDAINKNNTKRELYEDALTELNHRLLILLGFSGEAADGGEVVWSDALPANAIEQTQALTSDLGSGLVSKQTASTKRGYDWTIESERMAEERTAGDNIGAAILRAFDRGQP